MRYAVQRPADAEARDAADTVGSHHRRQRSADTHHAATQEPPQLRHQPARRVARPVRPPATTDRVYQ